MIQNKVIVITGGAGLLGTEFIRSVVKHGGIAIIADVNKQLGLNALNQIAEELQSTKVDFFELNITSIESISNLLIQVHQKYGRIDAVVNNAYPRNANYGAHYFDVSYEDFCENVNLNLGGYFLVGQQFNKYFVKQGFGNIINISSIYGVVAPKFEIYNNTKMTMPVEYAVIKSGLLHLTRYMAKYLKGKNIRVNSISFGGIKDAQPLSFLEKYKENCLNKGMLIPEDITGTLIFLLSDQSEFINGQNIIVDDGFTL